MIEKCIFKFQYGDQCDDKEGCSSNKGRARIDTLIHASKCYKDDLHLCLEQLYNDESLTVYSQSLNMHPQQIH